MPHTPTTLGASIRTLRLMAGMTLDEAAAAAKVSATYLSRVETNRVRATTRPPKFVEYRSRFG